MFEEKNKVVVKSNELIEARYRLSIQEQHVVLWLLTQIKAEDDEFKTHSMRITEFAKMIGADPSNQYKELRKVTMSLVKRGLEIYEPELEEWLQVTWLNSARYKKKQGIVTFRLSNDLVPYLLQLSKCFTKINLSDALKFRSIYTYRIYELLIQYKNIGSRKTTIKDLRGWCCFEDTEYLLYSNLKKDVLNKASTEINAKTNYVVEYEEIKQSRKVVAIDWTITTKPTTEETPSPNLIPAYKKELAPGDTGYVPPRFDNCIIPEIVEFCKKHESTMRRDLIDYLLQVVKFSRTKTTLELTFDSAFFRDKVDVEEAHEALIKHFKVENVEMV